MDALTRSRRRSIFLIFALCLTFAMTVMGLAQFPESQSPQEPKLPTLDHETKGLAEPPPQVKFVPVPDGTTTLQVNWGQLAAMLACIAGIQALISKIIVEPMLNAKFKEVREEVTKLFPSAESFRAHILLDDEHQDRIEKEMNRMWVAINAKGSPNR